MTKISSPSAPVAPSLPESVTAHEAPDRQVEEPSAPQAEEASTENGQGATKMEVDTPAPTALQSEVPVASESQEQASTSLKRNSPDEASEHERTVKRVKEEEKVDSMNVSASVFGTRTSLWDWFDLYLGRLDTTIRSTRATCFFTSSSTTIPFYFSSTSPFARRTTFKLTASLE
jgi:hypothetical protein